MRKLSSYRSNPLTARPSWAETYRTVRDAAPHPSHSVGDDNVMSTELLVLVTRV